MNPSYFVKIKRKKYPVFRSPVSEEQMRILWSSKKYKTFFIHDGPSGKIKKYELGNNMPKVDYINLDISFTMIAKIAFASIMSYYAYRLIKFSPGTKVDSWKKSNREFIDKEVSKMKEAMKKHSPQPNPTGKVAENNGWVIEEIN